MISFLLISRRPLVGLRVARDREALRAALVALRLLLIAGTVSYATVEGWKAADALYFSVVTLATVGHGDPSPRTAAGMVFTIVYILVGAGLFAAVAGGISQTYGKPKAAKDEPGHHRDGHRPHRWGASMMKCCFALAVVFLLSACTSYGVVRNTPITATTASHPYGIKDWKKNASNSGDLFLILAFSGGGTRAAALSYGVLKTLRDTTFRFGGRPVRLLDEVDVISSVSGGSFTAAYYGLRGEAIFTEFESAFLRRDIQTSLIDLVLNPFMWFSNADRTEWAINFYEENIFHGATFADMARPDRPFIMINASDLGYGVRFSFIQEYFGLLCSDLATFPVARAVAASSAVPLLFNPVVVQNFADCNPDPTGWLKAARQRAAGQAQTTQLLDRVATYLDKDKRKYAHFVDGGVTDNLGLRAILDIVGVQGGLDALFENLKVNPPRHIVIISVNAATDPEPEMDASNKQPSLSETASAISDVQLQRYSAATLDETRVVLAAWARAVSTPQRPVSPHLIQLSFSDVPDSEGRRFFQTLPTSFSLTNEQVDKLIAVGGQLLRSNPDFRRFMAQQTEGQ